MLLEQVAVGPARLAFTDRHGGVSTGAFASLDLGTADGQSPQTFADNLARLAATLNLDPQRMVFGHQVHGADVAVVTTPPDHSPTADALVTDQPGIALVVRVADCVPVLLADPVAGVVGAAHSGRRGTQVGVVPAVVARMVVMGAEPERMVARVGPAICGRCYEVPASMRDELAALVPDAASTTSWGTPAIDVPSAVLAQLRELHVQTEQVPVCTMESSDLFSYRRDHPTGRSVGVVWLEE